MSIAKIIAKTGASVAGAGLVAMSFGAALPAFAQTTTSSSSSIAAIQAQIASLEAQLAALSGGTTTTTAPSTTFTRDLTIGSTGSDVTALQTWLISKGFSIPAGATGYFGSQTQAALAAFQAANGISPAAGYFGPITRAKLASMSGTTTTTTGTGTTTTTTTGGVTLTGGEGSFNNFQSIGASSTILGQGQSAQVYGFQFTAGGSDLLVDRVYYDVALSVNNSQDNASQRPWNVFSTATLTDANGNTIATIDASNQNNWSQAGTGNGTFGGNGVQVYRLGFSGLNQVVKMNANQTYYLALQTQPVVSSSNNGAQYQIELESQGVRATDATGLQEYSPALSNISAVTVNATTALTASISVASNNPQTTTIQGQQTTQTNNVVLNSFTITAQGGNATVYSLPVTVTTTGTSPSDVVQSLSLYNGSTLLNSVSPAATTTPGTSVVTFNNLNLQIPEGTTDNLTLQANIAPIDGTTVPNGATVTVSVPGTAETLGSVSVPSASITDSAGNNASISGASTGNAIGFAANGISVGAPTTSATVINQGGNVTAQTGTFTFTFNVTAFGQTIYVASTSSAFGLTVHDSTTGLATSTTGSAISSTATKVSSTGDYMISNGQTQSFTVTATEATGHGDFFYATLNSLKYGTGDAYGSGTGGVTQFSQGLPTTFTTQAVSIQS